jgi:hypothetical protein
MHGGRFTFTTPVLNSHIYTHTTNSIMKTNLFPGILIAFTFFLCAILTVSDYGVDWDSPENFDTGEINLHFFETFDPKYLQYNKANPLQSELLRPELSLKQPASFLPVANIFAALAKQVFHDNLGWLDKFSSYHLSIVLFATMLLCLLYLFCLTYFDLMTAVISTASLALFPSFVGFSHVLVKDIPMAFFFFLSIFSCVRAYETQRTAWIIMAGILFGLSINVKINALFIPIILGVWLVVANKNLGCLKTFLDKKWLLLPAMSLTTVYASWPFLWLHPIAHFRAMIRHFVRDIPLQRIEVTYLGNIFTSGVDVPWHYAPVYLGMSTPLVILAFSAVGFFLMAKDTIDSKNKMSPLVLIWFFVVIGKFMFTNVTYSGIRLFLEAVPALCVMAGYGAACMYTRAFGFMGSLRPAYKHALLSFVFIVLYVPTLIANIQIHPYQFGYFNELVGGPGGVYESNLGDLFYSPAFKDGAEWLNRNAPPGSTVKIAEPVHIAKLYLRSDIVVADRNAARYDYLMLPHEIDNKPHPSYMVVPHTMTPETKPVFAAYALGAPVAVIYKNE